MNAAKKLNYWADNHFFTWVDKRVGSEWEHQLHRRNLYTFPTPMGFAYLALAILIWLLGTNYQNNLILSLSYLQISLFVVAILHTYFNLAGVSLKLQGHEPVFAGDSLKFRFQVSTRNKTGCDGLALRWREGPFANGEVDHLMPTQMDVPLPTTGRGIYRPERLLVESRYPFGLIRCWSWLKFPAAGIAYPAPVVCAWPGDGRVAADDGEREAVRGGDDFYGFVPYQPGASLRTVAWKHYARGRGLVSKQFAEPVAEEVWLRLADFNQHSNAELALGEMSFWAGQLMRQNKVFGLILGDTHILPDSGDDHHQRVLQALAMFEVRR